MIRTYNEINRKIDDGDVVVLTKNEFLNLVESKGIEKCSKDVDVVTTGTFGPMCSSGVFLNVGHTTPRIKLGGGKIVLNGVPAYSGIAAVDLYLGATAVRENGFTGNRNISQYGGGHVIHDLIAGNDIKIEAEAKGTDCYPKKKLDTFINIKEINEAILCNPRNAYQNYNCAVNVSNKTLYTYMGVLKPNLGNATFSSAGELSPLLNDPLYKTIGIGTRIFLGGGIGYVFSNGTQHNPEVKRGTNDVPIAPAGTIAVTGNLKKMHPDWLVGISLRDYGTSLKVGIGIPIPILNIDIARHVAVRNIDLFTQIVDYSRGYPNGLSENLGTVSYADLYNGDIKINSKNVPTTNLSSHRKAMEITRILKEWILSKRMKLTEPLEILPSIGSGYFQKSLDERKH